VNDQTSPSREPLGEENQPRKGRTIDIEATEIKNADVEPEAPSDAQPAQAAEQMPDSAAESLQREGTDASPPPDPRRYIDWRVLIAGGLGGAVIAAAFIVAAFLLFRVTDLKELSARLSRIEGELNQASSSLHPGEPDPGAGEALASRIAKLEETIGRLGSAPADVASAERFSVVEWDLKALSNRIGMLTQQSEGATAAAREARQRADANAAAVSELARKVATVDNAAGRDKIVGEIRSLADRVGAVESTLSKARDSSSRLAVAAIALNSAVERGQPFASDLAAVKSLGANPELVAPLEPFAASGIPMPATLSRELLGLIPSLRAVGPIQGSFLTRLQANAEKLVHIRPQQEKAGNAVSAIVDRIEIKAANADIDGALAELEDLPPAMRAPADAWIQKTKARSAAQGSSRRLVAASLAGLSK
jgi:hypothetical protein